MENTETTEKQRPNTAELVDLIDDKDTGLRRTGAHYLLDTGRMGNIKEFDDYCTAAVTLLENMDGLLSRKRPGRKTKTKPEPVETPAAAAKPE